MAKAQAVTSIDLTSLNPKQLRDLIDKAQEQVQLTQEKRIAALRDKIEKMCVDEGLTMNQVLYLGRFGKVAPKFKDPSTGKTWSGRGKKPSWLEGNEAEMAIT